MQIGNRTVYLKVDEAELMDYGRKVAHAVTVREPDFSVNHCNLVIMVKR